MKYTKKQLDIEKNKKLQEAFMEFISQYGWAILVAIAVIGAFITYFYFSSPHYKITISECHNETITESIPLEYFGYYHTNNGNFTIKRQDVSEMFVDKVCRDWAEVKGINVTEINGYTVNSKPIIVGDRVKFLNLICQWVNEYEINKFSRVETGEFYEGNFGVPNPEFNESLVYYNNYFQEFRNDNPYWDIEIKVDRGIKTNCEQKEVEEIVYAYSDDCLSHSPNKEFAMLNCLNIINKKDLTKEWLENNCKKICVFYRDEWVCNSENIHIYDWENNNGIRYKCGIYEVEKQ